MLNNSKDTLGSKVLTITAWIIGAIVGRYSGINLLLPLIFTGITWWLANKILSEQKKIIVPAFAIQTGHTLWLLIGSILAGSTSSIYDIAIIAFGLTWLLIKPNPIPLYLLGTFQLIGLTANGYMLSLAELGSSNHKALLIHVIWRLMAIFFITKTLFDIRKMSKSQLVTQQSID